MIIIKNIKTLSGEIITHTIPSDKYTEIDGENRLLLLPGIIDPHLCLGPLESMNWNNVMESAIKGGITSWIDIPYEHSYPTTKERLEERSLRVNDKLSKLNIPPHYSRYLTYSDEQEDELDVLAFKKTLIKGVVINLEKHNADSSEKGWENLFRLAAQEDIPIVLNSCDEDLEKTHGKGFRLSLIERAIKLTEKWSNRLYVLNVSNDKEINLIQEGREKSLLIYAETNPRHLFPDHLSDADSLWEALNNGIIETIGSGFNNTEMTEDKIIFKEKEYSFF